MNSAAEAPAATKAGAATSVTADDDHPGSTARASPVSQSVMWCTTIATRASPRSRSRARIRAPPDGGGRSGAGGAWASSTSWRRTWAVDDVPASRLPVLVGARGYSWRLEGPLVDGAGQITSGTVRMVAEPLLALLDLPSPDPSRAAKGPRVRHDPHMDHGHGVELDEPRWEPALPRSGPAPWASRRARSTGCRGCAPWLAAQLGHGVERVALRQHVHRRLQRAGAVAVDPVDERLRAFGVEDVVIVDPVHWIRCS